MAASTGSVETNEVVEVAAAKATGSVETKEVVEVAAATGASKPRG